MPTQAAKAGILPGEGKVPNEYLGNPLSRRFRVLDARLAILLHQYRNDENNLPYFISDDSNDLIACFRPTTGADLAQIQSWPACGSIWYPGCSAFYATWIGCVGQSGNPALKLEITNDRTGEIQGLLLLDHNNPCGNPAHYVLEAAPHNQTGNPSRRYHGVGRALVVRMVIECFITGGRVFSIRTNPRNVAFYKRLYFTESSRASGWLYLNRQDAERLLTEFFFG